MILREKYESLYGVRGHITSLKHFRPETAPDEWETPALQKFERGAKEISEIIEMDGKPYYRYMVPMITQKGCLKCHGHPRERSFLIFLRNGFLRDRTMHLVELIRKL